MLWFEEEAVLTIARSSPCQFSYTRQMENSTIRVPRLGFNLEGCLGGWEFDFWANRRLQIKRRRLNWAVNWHTCYGTDVHGHLRAQRTRTYKLRITVRAPDSVRPAKLHGSWPQSTDLPGMFMAALIDMGSWMRAMRACSGGRVGPIMRLSALARHLSEFRCLADRDRLRCGILHMSPPRHRQSG